MAETNFKMLCSVFQSKFYSLTLISSKGKINVSSRKALFTFSFKMNDKIICKLVLPEFPSLPKFQVLSFEFGELISGWAIPLTDCVHR